MPPRERRVVAGAGPFPFPPLANTILTESVPASALYRLLQNIHADRAHHATRHLIRFEEELRREALWDDLLLPLFMRTHVKGKRGGTTILSRDRQLHDHGTIVEQRDAYISGLSMSTTTVYYSCSAQGCLLQPYIL